MGQLLAAGGVGARLDVAAIPVLPVARAAAERVGEPPWSFAARSGEEYELIAALPPYVTDAELAGAPVPVTVIGVIEEALGLRATSGGREVALPPGHDHFGIA